jgi:hypothetical protein
VRARRAVLRDGSQPEEAFQSQVLRLAALRGYLAYHTRDSRRSTAGFPDLVLCRPPRLLLVECKSGTGRLSGPQALWLATLQAVPGVETYVWDPSMWADLDAILA